MQDKLNATAYSLLGLFNKQPWSAYDLAAFMESSVIRYILPRTRSQVFNEPKKLAKLGLLSATQERNGKRNRTVYAITDAGREAFAAWLAQPGEPQKTEYKSLLKLYLSDPQDSNALIHRIQEMRQQTHDEINNALQLVDRIVEHGPLLKDTALVASSTSLLAAEEFKVRLNWLDQFENSLAQLEKETDRKSQAEKNYRVSQQRLRKLQKLVANS